MIMFDASVAISSVIGGIIGSVGLESFGALKQDIVKSVVLAGVSLVTYCAFFSAHAQLPAILGSKGMMPVEATLGTIKEISLGARKKQLPWYDRVMPYMLSLVYEKYYTTGDYTRHVEMNGKIDLALCLLSLVYPHPLLFLYLYVSYYSIKRVGGRFFNFQWDALLLETLLLTSLLSMSYDAFTTKLCLWLFKMLLFRLMLGSGVVKYCSGDASWSADFTAMDYHFLTQPLPNSLGMLLYNRCSKGVFKAMTIGTLLVEGIVPFLPLLNLAVLNRATAGIYMMLQLSISATGYYGFFNYLTIVLGMSLLDDAVLVTLAEYILGMPLVARALEIMSIHSYYSATAQVRVLSTFGLLSRAVAALAIYPAVLLVTASNAAALYLLAERTGRIENSIGSALDLEGWGEEGGTGDDALQAAKDASSWAHRAYLLLRRGATHLLSLQEFLMANFYLGSHYGLFANMTKIRNEILIEVSTDGTTWRSVELLAKPGDPDLPPKTIWPPFHLPRVDWVFWFLAFKPVKELLPKWFWILVVSIMEGDNPHILRLLHPTANGDVFQSRIRQATAAVVIPAGGVVPTEPLPPLFQFVRVRLVNYNFSERLRRSAEAATAQASGTKSGGGGGSGEGAKDVTHAGSDANGSSEESSPVSSDSSSGSNGSGATAPITRVEGKYWSVLPLRVILPPTALCDIYAILDTFDERIQARVKQRAPPSAETAKDIIMRTLFANLLAKQKKKKKE